MQAILLTTPGGASAEIYSYGAHLTSWKTASGRQWIFLSSQATFEQGKSIRGGVPVIFPQFSERGPGPRHGFARTSQWQLIEAPSEAVDNARCIFQLSSNQATGKIWPHQFTARYQITLSDAALELQLTVINTDSKPFTFSAALHTYFAISALENVTLSGLCGKAFWNNDGSDFDTRHIQQDDVVTLTDAMDRVYFAVPEPLQLADAKDALTIAQSGFDDIVVWNPGREGAKNIGDMADEEYQSMLCVEAAVIDNPVTLKPGEGWVGVQRLTA
ncbi:MAG: D-hexose-6-phosphate mutarotase [Halioglobus sp.]